MKDHCFRKKSSDETYPNEKGFLEIRRQILAVRSEEGTAA
jgi:hypothetical protein